MNILEVILIIAVIIDLIFDFHYATLSFIVFRGFFDVITHLKKKTGKKK